MLSLAGLGGILGVLFSVPLRRSLIIEQDLAFPEGKGAAARRRQPARGLKVLTIAGLLGGVGKFAAASGPSWGIAIPIYSAWFLDGNAALAARCRGRDLVGADPLSRS